MTPQFINDNLYPPGEVDELTEWKYPGIDKERWRAVEKMLRESGWLSRSKPSILWQEFDAVKINKKNPLRNEKIAADDKAAAGGGGRNRKRLRSGS